MLEKLFNKNLNKVRKGVEDDLNYAERMMLIYHDEYRKNPSDVIAKEQYDFWRGKREAFMITNALIKDLCANKTQN